MSHASFCRNCQYNTGSVYLRCTVNPVEPNLDGDRCVDFEQRDAVEPEPARGGFVRGIYTPGVGLTTESFVSGEYSLSSGHGYARLINQEGQSVACAAITNPFGAVVFPPADSTWGTVTAVMLPDGRIFSIGVDDTRIDFTERGIEVIEDAEDEVDILPTA